MKFQPWDCHTFMGEARQVTFKFGHDFRERKLWIVERGTGRKIAELATDILTAQELDLSARLIRSAPMLGNALFEAQSRLWRAKHPNAVRLRQLIADALRGLEEPISDEATDRIDP
jgi:hypothetical protein